MRFIRFRKDNSPGINLLLGIISILFIIFLWYFISALNLIKPLFLPSPYEVFKGVFYLFINQGFLHDIFASVYRVGLGYILSIAFAIPMGLILGSYPFFGAMATPIISFFRFVPVSALVPLLILWFGIGNLQKVILIFIGISFYLLAFVISHVQAVKQEYIDSSMTLGANNFIVMIKVILPACYKSIYDSIRTLLGGGWTLIVLAELVAAESGVGKVIIDSQRFLHTDRLIAAIIIVAAIGFLSDYILKSLETKIFPWLKSES
jgi:NitT/TauT family transport system permease protein